MENNSIEMALLEPEERELVSYIYDAIPASDRGELTADDILLVLDLMDDYLEEQGLVRVDPETEEMEYLDGEVDETEQLQFVLKAMADGFRSPFPRRLFAPLPCAPFPVPPGRPGAGR